MLYSTILRHLDLFITVAIVGTVYCIVKKLARNTNEQITQLYKSNLEKNCEFTLFATRLIAELTNTAEQKGMHISDQAIAISLHYNTSGIEVLDYLLGNNQADASATRSGLLITLNLYQMLTSDELKAIITHELGHIYLKHVTRTTLQNTLLFTAPFILSCFWRLIVEQQIPYYVNLFATLIIFCAISATKRRHELEADAFAVSILGNHRGDLCRALDKRDGFIHQQAVKFPVVRLIHKVVHNQLMCSHPETADRKKAILAIDF